VLSCTMIAALCLISSVGYAQEVSIPANAGLMANKGVIITLILIAIPVIVGILLLVGRIRKSLNKISTRNEINEAKRLANYLATLPEEELNNSIKLRKEALDYRLSQKELSGELPIVDKRGLITENPDTSLPFVAVKKKATKRPPVDSKMAKLVLWFTATATFWLIFGTTVGE